MPAHTLVRFDDALCQIGVPDPQGKGRFWGRTPSQNMQLQIAAVTWRIETRSDCTFYQITLVLVLVLCLLNNIKLQESLKNLTSSYILSCLVSVTVT